MALHGFSAEQQCSLLILSPPMKQRPAAEVSALEDRLSICLARFPPRVKLGFGTVTCGKSKTFPVEVVVPSAKDVSNVVLQVQQQYQKGKTVPHVYVQQPDGATQLVESVVCLEDGTDRIQLLVQYAPPLSSVAEDTQGVLGSISLHCMVGGMLLKGEMSVTGKAVADVSTTSKARGSVHGASNPAAGKPGSLKPPLRPPAAATLQKVSGAGRAIASTPRQATRSRLAVDDTTANLPTGTSKQVQRPDSPSRLSVCSSAATSITNDTAVTTRDQQAKGADSVAAAEGAAAAMSVAVPQHAGRSTAMPPAHKSHSSGAALKRSLSLTGSQLAQTAIRPGTASVKSSSVVLEPAALATPRSVRPPTTGSFQCSTPSQRCGSVAGSLAAPSTASRMRQQQPVHNSPSVAVREKRSYLQVHAEGPLMKQERALTAWLNTHLMPQQQLQHTQPPGSEDVAPALTLQRMSAQAQGLLWRLYKRDPHVFDALKVVYAKIDAGVFQLTEVPIVMDVRGLKQMVEPLLSYNTFWLRAGLVTVLRGDLMGSGAGDGASTHAHAQGLQAAAHKGVGVLVREGLLYEKEVYAASDKNTCWLEHRGLILKNFLLMVLLLDRAVTHPDVKLPSGAPPLFNLRAAHKSSNEVVRAFLSQRLSGMGDAQHHLERWGYKLHAAQAAVDEYDYGITSLKEDLRSGVRLAKLYEVLTGFPTLLHASPPMWLHPVCDQQYVDNMTRVLAKYQLLGVLPAQGQRVLTHTGPQPLRARDMVDACRDITLAVLWSIAIKWQVPHLVDRHALHQETHRMVRLLSTRLRRPAPEPLDIYPDNRHVNLLLKWAQSVCALHGMRLHNFTNSFGDGRALCYLVSTYLPDVLPESDIYQPSAPKPEDVAILIEGDENVDMDTLRSKGWCAVYEAGGYIDDKGLLKSYKDGVRKNFSLLNNAVSHLGHVPTMLSPEDFLDGGLEEKCVILYIAHLAGRLLQLSREQRAAHVITAALRKHLWLKKYGPQQQHQAAVVIQKYWRRQLGMHAGLQARQDCAAAKAQQLEQRRHAAAAIIQVAWKEHKQRVAAAVHGVLVRYQQLVNTCYAARARRAAILIQATWRGCNARRQCAQQVASLVLLQAAVKARAARLEFLCLRGAAVLLQRVGRAHLKAVQQQQLEAAATLLQACWRARKHHCSYQEEREATIRVQAIWRGHQARQQLATRRTAARTIQSCWRGWQVRRQLAVQHSAATSIQAAWKGHAAVLSFTALKHAAVVIQAAWRGHLAMKLLNEQHTAATCIQAAWHGASVRRAVAASQHAACIIQAYVRCHACVRKLAGSKQAATLLQSAWRARCACQKLDQQRGAVLNLQAAWRGRQARNMVQGMHDAATRIQTAWRMHRAQAHYHQQLAACCHIQAAWRGMQVRRTIQKQHAAATGVQSAWRGHVVRVQLHRQHQAATIIQAAWRCAAASAKHAELRTAACMLQATWRCQAVLQQQRKQRRAAVQIQAAWRGRRTRAAVHKMQQAACTVQSAWRMHVARSHFVQQHHAASVLQSAWRTRHVIQNIASQQAAAVIIQACWRGCLARRQAACVRSAAVTLQAFCCARLARRQLQSSQRACISIQAAWRGHTVRRHVARQHQSAALIQQHWLGWHAARRYASERTAIIGIQAAWRCHHAQQRLQTLQRAAVFVQSAWRSLQARRLLTQHQAARSVQRAYRGHVVRQRLQHQQQAATHIQAAWRRHTAVQQYIATVHATQTIQAHVRRYQAQQLLCTAVAGCTAIQRAWRARQGRIQLAQHQAAARIQAFIRGWHARRELQQQRAAALVLQSAWRGWQGFHQHQQVRCSIIQTQAAYRRWAACKHAAACRSAIVCFQATWRRRQALHEAAALHAIQNQAATVIQAVARSWHARRLAEQRYRRLVRVQAVVRGFLARKHAKARKAFMELQATAKKYMYRFRAACIMQAWWRGRLVRRVTEPVLSAARELRRRRRAVSLIEKAYLAYREHRRQQQQHAALEAITRHVPRIRQWLQARQAWHVHQRREVAATYIQSTFRMWLVQKHTRRVIAGVTRVQALWRGWSVRQTDGKQMLRKKLAAAAEQTARNPHKTLGARVREALEQLLRRKDPAQLSAAVAAMETGTRYSVACCELIATEGAAALLQLARGCNRSKPHADLLLGVVSVLHNISRHACLLAPLLAAPDCMVILSERLQFFRDVEEVFMPLAQLVTRLLSAPGAPLAVARLPGVLKHWEGIAQIIVRRIEAERKYISRLEGQKGSDVSAKEATKKLLAAGKQLEALQGIITTVTTMADANGVQVEHHNTVPHSLVFGNTMPAADIQTMPESVVPVAPASARVWQPKNTLIRGALKEVSALQHQMQLAAAQQLAQQQAMLAARAPQPASEVVAGVVEQVYHAAVAPPPAPVSARGMPFTAPALAAAADRGVPAAHVEQHLRSSGSSASSSLRGTAGVTVVKAASGRITPRHAAGQLGHASGGPAVATKQGVAAPAGKQAGSLPTASSRRPSKLPGAPGTPVKQ